MENNDKPIGLYVHIPYCVNKCAYCDFKSFVGKEETSKAYFDVLRREIISQRKENQKVNTIYIGGGTPSVIDPQYIKETLNSIRQSFELEENSEISIECNPGTVTMDKLEVYKEAGINRISIGLQSGIDEELKTLGRIHRYKEYEEVIGNVVTTGFTNISTDIMLGIPGQTKESLHRTFDALLSYPLTHISVYSLSIEEGTPFFKQMQRGELALPEEDSEREMYDLALEILKENGFGQYEISNFSKEGYECRHNLKYWSAEEYLGFGLGAHSYMGDRRYWNCGTLEGYISTIERISIEAGYEYISTEESMREYMILGLRLISGVNINSFKERYGAAPKEIFDDEIERLIKQGLVKLSDSSIVLTRKGLDYANIAFMEFVK